MFTAILYDFTGPHMIESRLFLKRLFSFFNCNGSCFCLKVVPTKTCTAEDDPMVSGDLQGKLSISPLPYWLMRLTLQVSKDNTTPPRPGCCRKPVLTGVQSRHRKSQNCLAWKRALKSLSQTQLI